MTGSRQLQSVAHLTRLLAELATLVDDAGAGTPGAAALQRLGELRPMMLALTSTLSQQFEAFAAFDAESGRSIAGADWLKSHFAELPAAIDEWLEDLAQTTRQVSAASAQYTQELVAGMAECRRRLAVTMSTMQRLERRILGGGLKQ